MPRLRLSLSLAATAALALAAPAAAAPVTASSDDPQDGTQTAATDVAQVRSAFDAETGTWSLTVRFQAPVSESDWGMINATISSACDAASGFGSLRASTKPSATAVFGSAGSAADGPQPDGTTGSSPLASATRSLSDDGREITLAAASPRLVGRTPGCVALTISHNAVIDALDAPARFPAPTGPGPAPAPVPPTGTGDGGGPGTPAPPAPARLLIALQGAPRTLSLRALRVTLKPFDVALTGTARLTARGAPLLAKGEWKAAAGRSATVRLKLTQAGRRWVRRHPRATVRLTIGARPPAAAAVTKTFSLKLRP